jgi:hypothetical protein
MGLSFLNFTHLHLYKKVLEERNYPREVATILSIRQINVRYKTVGTGIQVISIKHFIMKRKRKPLRTPRHIFKENSGIT